MWLPGSFLKYSPDGSTNDANDRADRVILARRREARLPLRIGNWKLSQRTVTSTVAYR